MQTKVTGVKKGFSKPIGIPYAFTQYACGHSVEMLYRDRNGDRHDPGNWLLQPEAEADCTKCDQNRQAVEEIIAFTKTPEYSHTTLRDLTASKTGEWMAFCVYQVDRTSPTQCSLKMSVEATPETKRLLREAGISFVPGPSRGQMAMA